MAYEEEKKMMHVAYDTLNGCCFGGELQKPVLCVGDDTVMPHGVFAHYSPDIPMWVLPHAMKDAVESGNSGGVDPETGLLTGIQLAAGDCICLNADALPAGTRGGKPRFYWMCEELLHEMVHQHCQVNGIDECDPETQWHNERFRDEAEAHGLRSSFFEDMNGWQRTEFADETVAKLYEALPADLRKALLNKKMREYHVNRGAVFVD